MWGLKLMIAELHISPTYIDLEFGQQFQLPVQSTLSRKKNFFRTKNNIKDPLYITVIFTEYVKFEFSM